MQNKDKEVPLDYFYINVDHFGETKQVFQDEGSFGDYLLMLRYKSGKRSVWDIGKMNARPYEAR